MLVGYYDIGSQLRSLWYRRSRVSTYMKDSGCKRASLETTLRYRVTEHIQISTHFHTLTGIQLDNLI